MSFIYTFITTEQVREVKLTFSSIQVSRLVVFVSPETSVTDITRGPDLVEMLNTDLMLTPSTADTAHKPDTSVRIIFIINALRLNYENQWQTR